MPQRLEQLLIGFFAISTISVTGHGVSKAQEPSPNYVSYRCELKEDQIVLTYNNPLPGDELSMNSWDLDSLWGPGKDEDHHVRRPIAKTCHLSGGFFKVQISPNGNPDVQGMCGGEPSSAEVTIAIDRVRILDTDFNDLSGDCNSVGNAKIINKIEVSGKRKVLYSYSTNTP